MPPDPNLLDPRSLYCGILDAWNAQDAKAMAGYFAPNGSIVGYDGSQVNGRTAIESHLHAVFADHPTAKYITVIREVRQLAVDVGMVRAVAGMIPPGKEDFKPELTTVHTLIATGESHRWQAAMFQSTPAAWHGRPKDLQAVIEELREAKATS